MQLRDGQFCEREETYSERGTSPARDSISKTEKLGYAGKSLHLDIFFLEGEGAKCKRK